MFSSLQNFLGSKKTNDAEPTIPTTAPRVEVYRPNFATLTLDHLTKVDSGPKPKIPLVPASPECPPATLPQVEEEELDEAEAVQKQNLALVDGPKKTQTRHVPSFSRPMASDARSYAGSILCASASSLTPSTPYPFQFTQAGGVRESDYIDDPFSDRAVSTDFASFQGQQRSSTHDDPFTNDATRQPPRLNTAFLTPQIYNPSPRSATSTYTSVENPFGDSPQGQDGVMRYSDCGVNPFTDIPETARRERSDDGGVADIWDEILGKVKNGETNAIKQQQQQQQTPITSAAHQDVLVDYDGRPPVTPHTQNRIQELRSSRPGMSPLEMTTAAKTYLERLEAEIQDLKRFKESHQQQVRVQQERSLVIDAITQEGAPGDRQSVMTVWPERGDQKENVPPMPELPVQTEAKMEMPVPPVPAAREETTQGRREGLMDRLRLMRKASVKPQLEKLDTTATSRAHLVNVPKEIEEAVESPLFRVDTASPTTTVASESPVSAYPDEKAGFGESVSRGGDLPPPYTASQENLGHFPDINTTRNATPHTQSHARTASVVTTGRAQRILVAAPSQSSLASSDDEDEDFRLPRAPPKQERKRFPVKSSSLPKLQITTAEGSDVEEAVVPVHLTRAAPGRWVDMAFTPTTPNASRSTAPSLVPAPATITLTNLGFRNQTPHEIRHAAEKKRLAQDRRARRRGRGGWCWLYGLCCGVREMSRKQKIFWWGFVIACMVVSSVVGSVITVEKHRANKIEIVSGPQFITLDNFPTMPVGNVTVTPRLIKKVNTCISPASLWSCSLPPPLAAGIDPSNPVFNWFITATNGTNNVTTNISPDPATVNEWRNVSTIDSITQAPLEGEETGFSITLLQSNTSTPIFSPSRLRFRRQVSTPTTTGISATGTVLPPLAVTLAAAAMLPSAYISQPLRFFNRGLDSEHYAFQISYDKTIYVRSITSNTASDSDPNPLDAIGGVSAAEARFVCRFAGTRFTTRIYTRANGTSSIVDPVSLNTLTGKNAGSMGGYAVSVEEDRAGLGREYVACWPVDDRGDIDPSGVKRVLEVRGIDTDNGAKGCGCLWNNFK